MAVDNLVRLSGVASEPDRSMKPKPKRLILNLLVASESQTLVSRDAVAACALFGVSENSVRVTLARLSAEGLIVSRERGLYQLAAHAQDLAEDVRGWRTAIQKLRPWNGQWIATHCAGLGRSDRSVVRHRERALELAGFRELSKSLFIRPDNLEGGVAAVRARLYKLGLESIAPVFLADDFDPTQDEAARALWNSAGLKRRYQKTREDLMEWLKRAHLLEPEEAARESFVIGDQAIRQLVFDPLLPEALVDAAARQAFVDTLLEYDRVGRRIWKALYQATATQFS